MAAGATLPAFTCDNTRGIRLLSYFGQFHVILYFKCLETGDLKKFASKFKAYDLILMLWSEWQEARACTTHLRLMTCHEPAVRQGQCVVRGFLLFIVKTNLNKIKGREMDGT